MSGAASLLAATPRYWPDESAPGEERPIRRWRVLHACDVVGVTASVADAQIQAGMVPSLLTPSGWYRPLAAEPLPDPGFSLLHHWQQVRQWRNRFAVEAVDHWAEVVHAHCFAAALAALRCRPPMVYDLAFPLSAALSSRPGGWRLRSLEVAERFALGRAAAVVVHSQAMWTEASQRGVHPENLFLVPDPVEAPVFDRFPGETGGSVLTVFVPEVHGRRQTFSILQAFAILRGEFEAARLLLEVPSAAAGNLVMAQAADAGVADAIVTVAPAERLQAMAATEIVLAGVPAEDGPNRGLIAALAHGRAVLAADVPQNREVTPQGRGCLWYRNDDLRDLAGRAAFLARNPNFRTALAVSGHAHLQTTRSPRVVARKYDDVYRHAFQRHHRGTADPVARLSIVRANS